MISKLLFSSVPFEIELDISNADLVNELESVTSQEAFMLIRSSHRVSDWLSNMNSLYIGTVNHSSFNIRKPRRNYKGPFGYPDIKGKIIRRKGKVIVKGVVTNDRKEDKLSLVFIPIIMSFLAFWIIQFSSGKGRPFFLASLLLLPYYLYYYLKGVLKHKRIISAEKREFVLLLKRMEKKFNQS